MKKNYMNMIAVVALAGTFAACAGGQTESTEEGATSEMTEVEATTADINLGSSRVEWSGTMVGVYTHTGTLNFTQGSIETAENMISGGSFTVDMASMIPTDANYEETGDRTKENLVGHLSSPDFFDVATYPTATFEITGSGDNTVTGNLTVRGKTNEERVEDLSFDSATNTWTGTLTFDRKKYDVAWDSQMKDMVLSDNIELTITLVL